MRSLIGGSVDFTISFSTLLLLLHGALELLLLELILQHLDLILEQFVHKLGHLVRGDFTGLLLGQDVIHFSVGLFKVSVWHAFDLVSSEEGPDELFGNINLEHARVVLVHGQEDVGVHFLELGGVDENIGQVLYGFLIVNVERRGSSVDVKSGISFEMRVPVRLLFGLAVGESFLLMFILRFLLLDSFRHSCLWLQTDELSM